MDDNLIFPIKFDLEKGVIEAGKDADKYLRQLENTLRQKPIKLDVAIDGAAPGSIDAISKRMAVLSTEFNKLAEAQRIYNRASGGFTPEAQKIIKEYAELTAATQTYAQSLSQITAVAKRQTQEQMKAQKQEIKRYEEYWKRKETENAKQAQQEVANAERARKAQQQRISQEQAADAKRYQEWLRQKNQEAVETERVERQKQQSRERTIAQQNREFAAQRQAEQQRQQAISASLRAEYQRIEAKKQAEAASRRELQMLNQQYAAEERRRRLADSQASIAKRQQVVKTLRAEENTIVNITAKLQHWQQVMNSSAMDGRQFKRAAEEVQRLSQKLSEAQARISQLTATTSNASARQSAAVKQVSQEFKHQDGYVSRLLKRLAVYASFSYASQFLTSIREVTAQFELQRVSLGAILQDANKGAQIFSQIKQFALKSPISILDLTKYTKQLAAYKIGYDELFDTTKRLADVSVGLGVDFQRIVLLYGQVRATGYLRASEVRQATEAGIPLVEELAAKLTKANGELVTAADVMDMISKRAISFDMVKDVFTDMTSAGGAFYQMQEKQGNTLYGLWAKLGDAASVMYEQLGNTGIVNEGMKETIQMLTELMRNWKAVGLTAATTILPAVAAMAAWKMATKALAKSVATATSERIAAEAKLATAMKGTDVAAQNAARSSLAKAKADEAAAIAAQKNATAQSKLKMGFMSLGKSALKGIGIGILVSFLIDFIYKTSEAITNFRKLKRELDSIYTETATLQDQSVRNFEFLADKAVKAASGSKEQTDALQELNRTYRDILPQEALTIENLTKMKGKYDALTQSIREYVAEQQRQKAESAIMEYYGTKIRDAQNDVRERLYDQDLSATEVGRFFAEFEKIAPKYGNDVWGAFRDAMIAAGVKDKKRIAEIWKKEFEFKQSDVFSSDTGNANIRALSEAYADQANELKGMNEQYRESIGNLGKFADMQKRVSDAVANATYKTTGGNAVDIDKQGDILDAMKLNLWVKQTAAEIQNNEDIKKAFAYMGEGIKSEWFSIINVLNSNDLGKVSQINFDAIIASVDSMIAKLGNKNPEILAILNTFRNYLVAQKKEYENMVPSKAVVVRWQTTWRQIVKELKISGQNMNRYLMGSAEDFETYRKRIKDEVATVIKTIALLQDAITKNKKTGKRTKEQQAADEKELQQAKERKAALEKLLAELDKIDIKTGKEKKGSKGSKSDTRLQVLQEVAQTLATINKEYDDLAKKEGASKALADIKERFKEILAYTNKIGGKFGLEFYFPTEFKTLQEYRNAILKVMQSLKGLPEGSEKTILDFKTMIGKADSDYLQKNIEAELKRLADRISRTKTAKEFYEKILEQTGDIELATRVSLSVYGSTGKELFEDTVRQIREVFKSGDRDVEIDLSPVFDMANQRIDYKALADIYDKYQDQIIEKNRSTAENIVKEGQKAAASWEKELAKAKDYEEQRTDIINRETHRRAEIYKSNLPQEEKDRLAAQSQRKQDEDLAKVNFEEFTKSEDYIKIFENLDNVATSSLKRLRAEMQALIDTNQNLSPENMKTLVKAMEDIDEQISERGFGNDMIQSVSDYIAAIKNLKIAKQELTAAEAEYQAQLPQLDEDIATAEDEKVEAQRVLNDLKNNELATKNQIVAAELRLNTATANVAKAEQAKAKAADKVKKAEQKVTGEQDKQKKATTKFVKDLQKVASTADQLAGELSEIKDLLGISEDSAAGLVFDSAISSLQTMSTAINAAATAQAIFNAIAESNPYIAIAAGVLAVGSAIASWISGSKVRKANKEIERQQKLLDQLEYTYGRLEKAAEKAFGGDYISNMKQQQRLLLAQQQAYMAQYDAEMSKGKKADEEKAQEYLNNARNIGDQIADMQGQIAAQMLGTDLTSAARDFAKAWLEAYKQFGNTADAMSEKFHEMVENMVVESLLAKVMERALKPAFDMIDTMEETDFYSEAFWKRLMAVAEQGASNADRGAAAVMSWVEKMGIDMKELGSEYTGIAKDIAGATSEEILQLSGFVNTALYHTAYLPKIYEELVAMRTASFPTATVSATSAGWTDWQQQAMDNYMAIQRNTAETVVECRRAADACERMTRLIRTKGSVSGIPVFLNN